MTLSPAPHDLRPPEAYVRADARLCADCGHEVVDRTDATPCPTCGSVASPQWSPGIGPGAWMIVAAMLVAVATSRHLAAFPQTSAESSWPSGFGVRFNPERLSISGVYLATLLLLNGTWVSTRVHRHRPRDRRLRWMLRGLAAVPLATLVILHALAVYQRLFTLDMLLWPSLLVLIFGAVPMPALTFLLLRRLASRAFRPRAAERVAAAGVCILVTLAAALLIGRTMVGDAVASPLSRSEIAFVGVVGMALMLAVLAGWRTLRRVRRRAVKLVRDGATRASPEAARETL